MHFYLVEFQGLKLPTLRPILKFKIFHDTPRNDPGLRPAFSRKLQGPLKIIPKEDNFLVE